MRKTITSFLIFLIVCSLATAGDWKDKKRHYYSINKGCITCLDDARVSFDHGTIVITSNKNRYNRDIVEITDDYELYVNDRYVETNRQQQELVEEYYDLMMDMVWDAKRIGWEGAKMGIEGAKVGLKAVVNVIRLIDPDYDTDDLEEELEEEAEKLEEQAELLEEEAEELEEIAEDLEDIHRKLRRRIPELRALKWF